MIKLLTAALITLSFSSAFAMDLNQFDPNYSVKNIIRSKMWYEGLEFKDRSKEVQQVSDQSVAELPEELTIALDKLDS
jgi:hypothetical protein